MSLPPKLQWPSPLPPPAPPCSLGTNSFYLWLLWIRSFDLWWLLSDWHFNVFLHQSLYQEIGQANPLCRHWDSFIVVSSHRYARNSGKGLIDGNAIGIQPRTPVSSATESGNNTKVEVWKWRGKRPKGEDWASASCASTKHTSLCNVSSKRQSKGKPICSTPHMDLILKQSERNKTKNCNRAVQSSKLRSMWCTRGHAPWYATVTAMPV